MKNRLKILRAERNVTQEKLAFLCGVSRATINNIENGNVIPNGDTMLKLSKALKVHIDEIFFEFQVV